jgi:hypothetical protein
MDPEPADEPNHERREKEYEAWMVGVALSDARHAIADIRCPHGEQVRVTAGPPRPDGAPLLNIHANCPEGTIAAQVALADIGAQWNEWQGGLLRRDGAG